jgi:hypothetical protein
MEVLNGYDRTTCTIVFVLHEETMNQYHRMAFYRGTFTKEEVIMWVMEHEAVVPFPVRATIDIAGHWRVMGFLVIL